jgi:hypothetical protein
MNGTSITRLGTAVLPFCLALLLPAVSRAADARDPVQALRAAFEGNLDDLKKRREEVDAAAARVTSLRDLSRALRSLNPSVQLRTLRETDDRVREFDQTIFLRLRDRFVA